MLEIYFLEREIQWTCHSVFIELIYELQKKFEVKLFYKSGKEGGLLLSERFNTTVSDCEIIIYDTENDILRSINLCEGRREWFDVFEKRNNPKDIFLLLHPHGLFQPNVDYNSIYNFKILGTVYYTFLPFMDYDYYYNMRKFRMKNFGGYEGLIDKMFCLFTTNRHDAYPLRQLGIVGESPGLLPLQDYLELAIKYKIGLAIHGIAEVCHREFEYMAMGLPIMHLEYINNTLNPPLIPNYHYISIDRNGFPLDGGADRVGGPEYVEAYKNRFYEVKDDYKFLDFISQNARKYYEDYCSQKTRINHLINLLEIK